ncbi:LysE type translocator [Clostridium puniceum]|uniref:LysE type translocator n=1 Tax=Clostridium puniceum TaxID=29367 RepID=A0A1S8T0Q2_9CLOT|nr:LysE family transporter [Clostridium puniceum]OOM71262.1 LysE type translocator [Clostridium puniceum]
MFSVFTIFKAILIGFFTGFVASIPLGPSGLESVSRSITKGFREGFKVSLGAVSADIVYIIIINLGFLTFFTKSPKSYSLFWIISGIVLIISTKISLNSKHSDLSLEKSCFRHASNGFLTGFFITFLNPTTPSLWIALSGTVFNVWRHHGKLFFIFSISAMIIGSITWFCFLNILVSRGIKKLNPNFAAGTTKLLDYFLFALGIIFVILGIYRFIF